MNTSNISVTIPKGSFSGGISAFGIASAVFRKEGVHFSDIRNFRLYHSIRGAIIKAVKQVTDSGV